MHMLDWNAYRQQIISGVGELAKLSPDTVKGYGTLNGAGAKTHQLDPKMRELIALAVAITLSLAPPGGPRPDGSEPKTRQYRHVNSLMTANGASQTREIVPTW